MKQVTFSPAQKRKAGTQLALAWSQLESAGALLKAKKYREAVVHMYFACFYASQAILIDRIRGNGHEHVERQLHKSLKERGLPPQSYVKLHQRLHLLRNKVDYRSTYVPAPNDLVSAIKQVAKYLRWASKVVPRVEIDELVADLLSTSQLPVDDLSFDVYPASVYYDADARITLWLPADPFPTNPKKLLRAAGPLLKAMGAGEPENFAVGLNSKLNQYEPLHMLMLDIDEPSEDVEQELAQIGGFLIKTRRGFHFIGHELILGQAKWEKTLRGIAKHRKLKHLVDLEHIEMSLKRGYSTLRLTETPAKPFVPFYFKDL